MNETKTLAVYTSRSEPGVKHSVYQDKVTGRIACTCKGFTTHGRCWHHTKVVDRVLDRGYKVGQ